MAEIKWIKITTDIFSDEKIMLIEQMPDADTILVIWFKLLCMAGRDNNNGVFLMNNKIPYTEEMFATIFRRPLNTVRLAISTFEAFGMIDIYDDVISLVNWEKHQNFEGMERIREQNRIRKKNQRERQKKALLEDNHVMSRDSHATEEDKEEEKDKEKDKNKIKNIDYQQIADMYNEICISFPKIRTLSDSRKKTIKARLNKYSVDDFRELFKKAEESDFLKGSNGRDWSADFDWMMKDSNLAKILEGKYDNKGGKHESTGTNAKGYDATDYYGDKQSDFTGF
jgi:predicted phage replisome organizer